jgi:hypothetical protein
LCVFKIFLKYYWARVRGQKTISFGPVTTTGPLDQGGWGLIQVHSNIRNSLKMGSFIYLLNCLSNFNEFMSGGKRHSVIPLLLILKWYGCPLKCPNQQHCQEKFAIFTKFMKEYHSKIYPIESPSTLALFVNFLLPPWCGCPLRKC